MHPNPAFRQTDRARNLAFAGARGFGVLALNGAEGPLMSHVPFLLDSDGAAADLHLVRSNPIVRALAAPRPAVIAVTGPDGYVSPDWYGAADQVPTWNYVAVHLRGTLTLLDEADMRDMLMRQSAYFEDRLRPKPPWTLAKMHDDTAARMMRQIVPARLAIATVDGTWKLNQNKPADQRLRAAGALESAGLAPGAADLAALMRAPPD